MPTIKARISGAWVDLTAGIDEVWVGNDAPVDPASELWVDADAPNLYDPYTARWNSSWGVVAIAPRSGTTVAVAANTTAAITQPLAFTTVVGRRYRLHYHCRAMGIVTAPIDATWAFALWDGAAATTLVGDWHNSRLNYDNVDIPVIVVGDGVAHSWTMRATTPANTGINFYDDNGCLFYIEDVGPTSLALAPPNVAPPGVWTALTLNTGWANTGGSLQVAQYRILSDMVQIRGEISYTTGNANPMATLPAGFRPPATINMPVINRTTQTAVLQMTIGSDGTISLFGITGTIQFSISNTQFSVTA